MLVIATGRIGDTNMCTPTMLEARRGWPGARIVVLGFPPDREILAGLEAIDELIETKVVPFTLRHRGEVAALKKVLAREKFDVALILLGDQFAAMLAELGVPVRVGVRGHVLAAALTHIYDIAPRRAWGPIQRLRALRVLGVAVDDETQPALEVPANDRSRAIARLEQLGLPAGRGFVVLHPFGTLRDQWWMLDGCGELAGRVERETGWRTILVGALEVRAALEGVGTGSMTMAVGSLSLRELVGSIAEAKCVITTDSGPFHIAGALRRPTGGLFRSARPEYAKLYPSASTLLGRHPACELECDWEHCAVFPCRQLASLTVEQVAAAVVAQSKK